MPPEPLNMIEMIGNIASSMQYSFTSCTELREIHFPTIENIINNALDIKEEVGQVSESFKNMLNKAVGEIV